MQFSSGLHFFPLSGTSLLLTSPVPNPSHYCCSLISGRVEYGAEHSSTHVALLHCKALLDKNMHAILGFGNTVNLLPNNPKVHSSSKQFEDLLVTYLATPYCYDSSLPREEKAMQALNFMNFT